MCRHVPVAVLVCACSALARPALAAPAGYNVSWDDCGLAGSVNQIFACDTNAGSHLLVASFIAPPGIDSLIAIFADLEFRPGSGILPNWWSLASAGDCRAGSLTAQFDFSGRSACIDYWATHAIGGINISPQPNLLVLRVGVALDDVHRGRPLVAGTEYYAFGIAVDNAKTAGADYCPGCQGNGEFVVVDRFSLVTWNLMFYDLPVSSRNRVIWQSDPLPAHNRTWGAVKSLYH